VCVGAPPFHGSRGVHCFFSLRCRCRWEIHEAFAGQVLANLAAMDSEAFLRDSVRPAPGSGGKVRGGGNVRGGRALQHRCYSCPRPSMRRSARSPLSASTRGAAPSPSATPSGATGTRLLTTSANRLATEGGRFAVMTACAAGAGARHADRALQTGTARRGRSRSSRALTRSLVSTPRLKKRGKRATMLGALEVGFTPHCGDTQTATRFKIREMAVSLQLIALLLSACVPRLLMGVPLTNPGYNVKQPTLFR